ncbi:MAG: oligosaccharide flippase family protein [Acidobacteriia bacterium]|nr:oligosaccharide flippase family protein [Terriglobia bacterium]
MTPFARILRLSAAYLSSNLARAAIAFGLSLVLGRALGAERFGRWILCTTWASTLTVVADLGFGVLLTRDGARPDAPAGRLLLSSLLMRLAVVVPLGAILVLAAPRLVTDPEAVAGVQAGALLGIAGAAYGCFGALFRAQPRWLPAVLAAETACLAAQLGGSWWIVHQGGGVVSLVALATLLQVVQIAVAIALWTIVFGARASVGRPSLDDLRVLLRRAIPFAASSIVANLQTRVAPLLLGYWSTEIDLGWFAAASRFGKAARLAPQAMFAGALPVLSHEYGRQGRDARRMFRTFDRALVALSLAMAAPCILLAVPLLRLLYGPSFMNAAPALVWVGLGLAPALVNSGRKVALFAVGGEAIVLRWSAASLAVQMVAAALLIQPFGSVGAAISIAIAEAAVWYPLRAAEVSRLKAEDISRAGQLAVDRFEPRGGPLGIVPERPGTRG